ncbi:MAG: Rne/Rng family ribonuclease [Acidobacteria bacterium]|nr:Rne/Rng family ribonuclease [Acidobacteriota bacterium]
MSKELIVSATALETKVAVIEEDQVTEIFIERAKSRGILGNIYKGKVTKVLPGMQSAFVDIGLERDAFLYVSDFVEDYEEYEKMFTDAEQAAEKLLKVEIQEDHIQPDEPRRRGRSRGRHRGRGDRPERNHEARRRERNVLPSPAETTDSRPAAASTPPVLGPISETAPLFETTPRVEIAPPAEIARPADITRERKQHSKEPKKPAEPGSSSSWLDEVREAQAALEREADHSHVENRSQSDSSSGGNWGEDRDAKVRGDRTVDEFSLSDEDTGGESGGVPAFSPSAPEPVTTRSETAPSIGARDLAPDPGGAATEPDVARPTGASGSPVDESTPAGPETPAPELPPAGQEDRKRRRLRRPEMKRRHGKNQHERHFSIDDLLREGQEITVQVAKEPIAKKGARITSHIALPGRFVVYMPTVDHVGVSRKIVSDRERARLKEIVTRLRGESKRGFIVRTAGENCDEKDLRADMHYLTRLWDEVRSKGDRAAAPAVVHSELDLVPRLLRDYVSGDFRAIRVDDEAEYERIVEFINKLDPSMVSRVKLYTKAQPIFDEYGINAEIEKALKQKVWLKSGGYIVINQTEALVAIDVNTGKFVGRGDSLEETITRTNLDAVKEVVRQIRLRDLGGIIVIDFIDMDERRNRQKVMEALERELSHDKSPTKILQFNEFGLVAITRKRVKQSLERTLCQPCPYCSGTGMVKSLRTVCYSIHAEVKKLVPTLGDGDEILIRVNPEVGRALREKESAVMEDIRDMTRKDASVKTDPLLHFEQFDIVEM